MCELYEKVCPDIYKIRIPLPENPLRTLNSYLVKTGSRNLLIDTGFNLEECRKALFQGLKELDADMENTDIFVTHMHSDHIGLAGAVASKNSKIYMSGIDYGYFLKSRENEYWNNADTNFISNGFPEDTVKKLKTTNPARVLSPCGIFKAETVSGGDVIKVGEHEFTCVSTPGHSPGHMCLYLEKEKLVFTGDHVLFDITPNITSWNGIADSLGDYIESLKKIRHLDVKTALPGHRENSGDFYKRIDMLLSHHEARLSDVLDILSDKGGLTAYETASKMRWSIRAKSFEDFPNPQKWFAMGETLSHLDYLRLRGKVERKKDGRGIYVYFPSRP
mgnify:CR=1 FL=1